MRLILSGAAAALLAAFAHAQISVISVERLPLEYAQEWCNPQFAPDGGSVYEAGSSFDGIWCYNLKDGQLTQVTAEPKSGYGYSFSSDGRQIGYRVTEIDPLNHRPTYTAVVRSLASGAGTILARGADVSAPAFAGGQPVALQSTKLRVNDRLSSTHPPVLMGIENTKIALVRNGARILLDPFKNGSYIWPSLSPDGKSLVAYEMSRGTFICDLSGKVLIRLGRRDAPSWTRDGKWIVYMDDRDDGHRLLSSDICMVSIDGKQTVRLTDTKDVMEMHPRCSPTEDRIVYDTPEGEIYLLTYQEAGE
ncbi:MAG TPA: hypothetical protein VF889_04675 [Bacteroidota bacterium]